MNVNIAELKARLSTYLNAVRKGETVVVLDRKTPIAKLVPLAEVTTGFHTTPASAPPGEIGKVRGVRLKRKVDVIQMLSESRGER